MGAAATWFSSALPTLSEDQQTWAGLKTLLLEQYGRRDTPDEVVAQLLRRRKWHRESYVEYAAALRVMSKGVRIEEATMITAFTNGIDDWARGLVRVSNPRTLTEAANQATRLCGDGGQRGRMEFDHKRGKTYLGKRGPDQGGDYDNRYGPNKHDSNGKRRREAVECWSCHEFGHYARFCPKRKERENDGQQGNGEGM
ncbi:TPA: hypothetical protein N0F65_013013 [Lagenidium giganteum]|uniref:CCHC-type domain-containing protein n=1 Tax=Lagenidium giganteum TaxID=4803 RepID=A0AAV2YS30_9STRA|nr:TPA: hypothetical protein N0F65_013013 [Lagenidium giganteum]